MRVWRSIVGRTARQVRIMRGAGRLTEGARWRQGGAHLQALEALKQDIQDGLDRLVAAIVGVAGWFEGGGAGGARVENCCRAKNAQGARCAA